MTWFEPSLISAMDSPNFLGYIPSCPNGISDTLRPLPSEWAYLNVAGKPIPCFRDAVMLKSACRYAFVGISGRSYRPRVFIGFFLVAACGRGFESRRRHLSVESMAWLQEPAGTVIKLRT